MMRKAIVLLSGGLDSATTLYLAKKRGYKCLCLIFDYGQRHRKEIASAKRIAEFAHCHYRLIKLNFLHKGCALLDRDIEVPKHGSGIPCTYVPARNMIFLSFALSYAETIGAKAIFIGANAIDYSGYPDCRMQFYRAFRKAAACGTKSGVEKRAIKIETPLIQKTKAGIIRLGFKLGVPFALTWSCYRGGAHPCKRCDSCYFRAKGFREAEREDPLK